MPQEAPDDGEPEARHHAETGMGVSQIVKANVFKPGGMELARTRWEAIEICSRLSSDLFTASAGVRPNTGIACFRIAHSYSV